VLPPAAIGAFRPRPSTDLCPQQRPQNSLRNAGSHYQNGELWIKIGRMHAFLTIYAPLVATAGLVMAFARTGPGEAKSKLSEWAEFLGFKKVSQWLGKHAVDPRYRTVAMLTVVFIAGMAVENREKDDIRREHHEPPSSSGDEKSTFLRLDDAKRWQLANSLFKASVGNSTKRVASCSALVWSKPDSKSAASFWNELNYVFYLGDWGVSGSRIPKSYFPDGISILAGKNGGDAFNCGFRLSEWLNGVGVMNVSFQANQTTPDLIECKNECIEMVIGDVTMR